MQAIGMEPISDETLDKSKSEPAEIPHCFVKMYKTKAKVRVDFEPGQFKDKYIDEYTGDVLEHSLIKAAIVDELTYFCEKEVWMLEDLDTMKNIAEHVFVRSRWVLSNKGDIDEPDMRARLVACEVNKRGRRIGTSMPEPLPLRARNSCSRSTPRNSGGWTPMGSGSLLDYLL